MSDQDDNNLAEYLSDNDPQSNEVWAQTENTQQHTADHQSNEVWAQTENTQEDSTYQDHQTNETWVTPTNIEDADA
jgi:hypothetical protein